MKKLALTSLAALFAVSTANAATNYFVGGSAAFGGAKGDNNTAWYVAPELGFHLNDNWDAGVSVGALYDNSISAEIDELQYGVEGFARYKIAQFDAFKVLLEGRAGVVGDSIVNGHHRETLWAVSADVAPMVTYDLSKSFTLYAKLNFLGAHAEYNFKNKDLGAKNSWEFSAFGDSSDVLNTGDFQIGFYYNF